MEEKTNGSRPWRFVRSPPDELFFNRQIRLLSCKGERTGIGLGMTMGATIGQGFARCSIDKQKDPALKAAALVARETLPNFCAHSHAQT